MNKLLKEWYDAKITLDRAKSAELKLREKVIEAYPGDQGTSHTEGTDFKLSITRGVTRSIDEKMLRDLQDQLTDEERACVSYKPSLDAKRYAELPDASTLSRAVIIKPSLPTVKLEIYDGSNN
jgi:hypothetical protein